MSYVSPNDLYAQFNVDKKEFYSSDSTTRSKILNYGGISSEFANLTAHVMAPIIGEAKPNRQVNPCALNTQSYSCTNCTFLCTQLLSFMTRPSVHLLIACLLLINQPENHHLLFVNLQNFVSAKILFRQTKLLKVN